jgi:hypothetical protein
MIQAHLKKTQQLLQMTESVEVADASAEMHRSYQKVIASF